MTFREAAKTPQVLIVGLSPAILFACLLATASTDGWAGKPPLRPDAGEKWLEFKNGSDKCMVKMRLSGECCHFSRKSEELYSDAGTIFTDGYATPTVCCGEEGIPVCGRILICRCDAQDDAGLLSTSVQERKSTWYFQTTRFSAISIVATVTGTSTLPLLAAGKTEAVIRVGDFVGREKFRYLGDEKQVGGSCLLFKSGGGQEERLCQRGTLVTPGTVSGEELTDPEPRNRAAKE